MIIAGNNPEPNTITYGSYKKKFCYGNYVYIPILKNAHRHTSAMFVAYGFKLDPKVELKGKTKIVTLRDPVQRWYAGMAQFLYYHNPDLVINESLTNFLTKIIVIDGHTKSQSNYLSDVDTDECVFFDMDDVNYEDNLQDYTRRTFGGIVDMNNLGLLKPENTTNKNPRYIEIKNQLEDICKLQFLQRLESYYKSDYDLIKAVTFYKKRAK